MRSLEVLRRSTATLLIATTTLSACTSWKAQPVTPEQVVSTQQPLSIRVQRVDGGKTVLDSPQVSGDSLIGAAQGKRTGVALADVTGVAVKHVSALKTVGLVLGMVTVVFATLAAVYVAEGPY